MVLSAIERGLVTPTVDICDMTSCNGIATDGPVTFRMSGSGGAGSVSSSTGTDKCIVGVEAFDVTTLAGGPLIACAPGPDFIAPLMEHDDQRRQAEQSRKP